MKWWLRRFFFTILLLSLINTPSSLASTTLQGTHTYQVVIQGTISTLHLPSGYSASGPMDFRSKLEIELFPPEPDGGQKGIARLYETYLQQGNSGLEINTNPNGYELKLKEDGSLSSVIEPIELIQLGINLFDIISIIFPQLPETIENKSMWSTSEGHQVGLELRDIFFDVTNNYQVVSMDDSLLIINNRINGGKQENYGDATVSIQQLGQGNSHRNPQTKELIMAALSLRTTVEESNSDQSRYITQIFHSTVIEKVQTSTQMSLFLGSKYVDPAQRFALRLPVDWYPEANLIHGTSTLFLDKLGEEMLTVEVISGDSYANIDELISSTLSKYQTQLENMSMITLPTLYSLGGEPANLVEYSFTEFEPYIESMVVTEFNDYYYILQYAVPTRSYQVRGKQLLQAVAKEFEYGSHPEGLVNVEKLMAAQYTLYENYDHQYSIELPNLWSLTEETEDTMLFQELGGKGQLTIQVGEAMLNESSYVILHYLVDEITKANSNIEVISPPQPMALGSLSGAGALIRMEEKGITWNRWISTAVWEETLFIVSIDYHSSGFDERYGIFQRILASFNPLPEWMQDPQNLQDAKNMPAAPTSDEANLFIGRIMYQYSDEGNDPKPAAGVLVEVYCDELYTARTDNLGYFYIANIPESPAYVETVQGPMFGYSNDVYVTLTGLTVSPSTDRLVHMGEMVLIYDPFDGKLTIDIDNSPEQNQVAESHLLGAHPRSEWSQIIRERLIKK